MSHDTAADGATRTVERYRKLLDSPYGRELHDHAEVELLAGHLRELVTLAEKAVGLHDEFGILDHGEGLRHANAEPISMPGENMAIAVELRAKGAFDLGSHRPATLMRREAGTWAEIPADATPDDILPGYSERKAAAGQEANA